MILQMQTLFQTIKAKYLFYIGAIALYLTPIQPALIAVGVLISIDFLFGIIGAVKTNQKIESKKMSQTLIKAFIYQLLIIAFFIVEKTLIPFFPMVQIVLTFIGITELLSISENFQKITGIPFIKYIKNILMGKLKQYSDSVVNEKSPNNEA